MKPCWRALALISIAVGVWSSISLAQFLQLDPSLNWQVLETEHFSIIFPPGTEGLARESAELAEEAWQYWLEELDYSPQEKTALVIVPNADFAIGGATTVPNNEMMLGTSQARSFSEWLNSRGRSGLEQVIYHEYGHIVDIGKVSGLSQLLRAIFGALIMPNGTKPGFFTEGIVISAEYRRSGASRSNAPRDAMFLREMWLHDLLPPLDRASQYGYDHLGWPSSYMLSHDYGAWLIRYLAEEYGPERIAKIDRLNAESPLTTLSFSLLVDFGAVLKRALGVSAREFFAGFKGWLGEQFGPQLERIKSEGVLEGRRISRLAYWNNDPAWSPDGEWVAYYHYDDLRQPGIRLIRLDGGEDHQMTTFEPGLDFFRPHFWAPVPAWSPDGKRLVYAKLERYNRYYIYGDIYLYDLVTGKERRLTRQARAYSPVFFPDGERILFAKQRWGERSPALAVLDLASGEEQILQEFPDDFLIDSFAISPDGSRLALSIWRWGGFQDLYLLPAAGGELLSVTQDRATDLDPAWSHDGRFLLFSSDRDGVNNLRPKLWLPLITGDGPALFTFGSDHLFQHNYSLVAGYAWQEQEPFYTFNYSTSRFGPTISLDLESTSRGARQRVEVSLPLVERLTQVQEVSLGYENRDAEGHLVGSWGLTLRRGFDLFREEREIRIEGERSQGGADPSCKVVLDWRERVRLPLERDNGLAFKLTYGWSNRAEQFRLGGHEGSFMLRGFQPGALEGSRALAGSFEYRFLISNIERGLGLWPLFLNWLEGSLFLDLGMAGDKLDLDGLKLSFGGELRPQIILGYGLPLELRLGIARGLGAERPSFYLGVGSAF